MSRLYRSLYIFWIVFRFGLDQLVLDGLDRPWLRVLARVLGLGGKLEAPRGVSLR